jgi:hypothetical protein
MIKIWRWSRSIALFVFSVLAPYWPSQGSDLTEIWYVQSSDLVVRIYVRSFRSIAPPAVTKRALLTDDRRRMPTHHDGQRVIVRAQTWAKKGFKIWDDISQKLFTVWKRKLCMTMSLYIARKFVFKVTYEKLVYLLHSKENKRPKSLALSWH